MTNPVGVLDYANGGIISFPKLLKSAPPVTASTVAATSSTLRLILMQVLRLKLSFRKCIYKVNYTFFGEKLSDYSKL